MAPESFTIGKLSQATGVNIETIRYYEKRGLIPPPPRTMSGYRRFGDDHTKRLFFIRRARELGFSLKEIGSLLSLVDTGEYTCGEVQSLTLHQLKNVKTKISDLRRLERTLAAMAAECEGGSVPECPVIDAMFDSGNQASSR